MAIISLIRREASRVCTRDLLFTLSDRFRSRRWWFPLLLAALHLGCFHQNSLQHSFSAEHRRPSIIQLWNVIRLDLHFRVRHCTEVPSRVPLVQHLLLCNCQCVTGPCNWWADRLVWSRLLSMCCFACFDNIQFLLTQLAVHSACSHALCARPLFLLQCRRGSLARPVAAPSTLRQTSQSCSSSSRSRCLHLGSRTVLARLRVLSFRGLRVSRRMAFDSQTPGYHRLRYHDEMCESLFLCTVLERE